MEDKNDLLVNGYRFGTEEDAKAAREECKKIEYFKEKVQGKNTKALLNIYNKLLEEKVFKTPAGWEYLRQLQKEFAQQGIKEEEIRPIPMYINFSYRTGEELNSAFVRQRIRPSKKIKVNRLQISVCINLLLGILVAAMFAIALQSNHPNILNYRQAVLNEYASWEQELSEREREVRIKEQTLLEEEDFVTAEKEN